MQGSYFEIRCGCGKCYRVEGRALCCRDCRRWLEIEWPITEGLRRRSEPLSLNQTKATERILAKAAA